MAKKTHTETRLTTELKPPLTLLLYDSQMGTVAIYISGDWKSRLLRTLGHLINRSSWMIAGIAFMPYNPVEMTLAVAAITEMGDIDAKDKSKLN